MGASVTWVNTSRFHSLRMEGEAALPMRGLICTRGKSENTRPFGSRYSTS